MMYHIEDYVPIIAQNNNYYRFTSHLISSKPHCRPSAHGQLTQRKGETICETTYINIIFSFIHKHN